MFQAKFKARPNRFVIEALRDDSTEPIRCYCPNTSRLVGLLKNDVPLLIKANNDPTRSTNFTVKAVRDRGHWVGIEASLANDIFENYLQSNPDSHFSSWTSWDREVQFSESQFDFLGETESGDDHWVEVKSLSSRTQEGRTAFFSGTPSRRGWRHLEELQNVVQQGNHASCVFVVQRNDVDSLGPGPETDSRWTRAIQNATENGVSIHGFNCKRVNTKIGWEIAQPLLIKGIETHANPSQIKRSHV